ncbi:MAG TPA: VOC family protein [Pyrinomonadaceae bacterium]|nr:VOC family protein [Pyrinomonadaceae bacterium]
MNLNQVTLHCPNTLETVEFYQQLGLLLIVDSLPRYARLECPTGDSTLSVQIAPSAETHSTKIAFNSDKITLYFECDDLDLEVSRLRSLGIEIDQEPVDREWLWREAYLKDPAGNKICLYHAGSNRKNPPWRVKSKG